MPAVSKVKTANRIKSRQLAIKRSYSNFLSTGNFNDPSQFEEDQDDSIELEEEDERWQELQEDYDKDNVLVDDVDDLLIGEVIRAEARWRKVGHNTNVRNHGTGYRHDADTADLLKAAKLTKDIRGFFGIVPKISNEFEFPEIPEFLELSDVLGGGFNNGGAFYTLDEAIIRLNSFEGSLTKNSVQNKKIERALEDRGHFWYRTANLSILRYLQRLR